MFKIFSVESRKGGVGKTTVALNLAKALTRKKYDVLLIDCDITGTPITKATLHSSFWKKDVVVAYENKEIEEGNRKNGKNEQINNSTESKPYNLLEFFEKTYLKGLILENKIIEGLDYDPQKIHLIGSEIYDNDGNLIIDPRYLLDDLHSYWFLDLIKKLINLFCETTKQKDKAIILDNSPGYVGIGRSIREWLTKDHPDDSTFVLVSSLDEQDIDSTISSAMEISQMFKTIKPINQYVKIIINKVPEDLIEESRGYINDSDNDNRNRIINALLPLGKDGNYRNMIKYDSAISGQFIESRLIPKASKTGKENVLEKSIIAFEDRMNYIGQTTYLFSEIASLDYNYKLMVQAMSDSGYIRMSKSLKGELYPVNSIEGLTNIVGRISNMIIPKLPLSKINKLELRDICILKMNKFISEKGLGTYHAFFMSLTNGLFLFSGLEKPDINNYQIYNLSILLSAFFAFHTKQYAVGLNFRDYIKKQCDKINLKKFDFSLYPNITKNYSKEYVVPLDPYLSGLLNSFFGRFNQAMCYTLLRTIDFVRDYQMLLNAIKNTIGKGAKMMSDDLLQYLKNVIRRKTEDYDDKQLFKLVAEPYEMKMIQNLLIKQVLEG